ncbi:MAG: hypothetical protein CMJ81_17380 [Planctomycetaceae bacterium]|jgi:hypothetical protein|nr:hypothetical protein [Planctomycetaceae bacterium]
MSQAGQHVSCKCGVLLEVPPLRSLRELETTIRAEGAGSETGGRAERLLLVFGLTLGVLALLVYAFSYTATLLTDNRQQVDKGSYRLVREPLDDLSPTEAWIEWRSLHSNPLTRNKDFAFREKLHTTLRPKRNKRIAAAIAIVGFVLAAIPTISRSLRRGG